MSGKPNHHCPVCNKFYYVCKSCRDRGTWKSVCDTPQHYQIYVTVVEFSRGQIPKETARDYLKVAGVDLDNLDGYIPDIADIIRQIYAPHEPSTVGGDLS